MKRLNDNQTFYAPRRAIAAGLWVLGLVACTPSPPSDLGVMLTSNDLRLEASGDLRATLQLFPNGKGSAEFASNPGFPVAFDWTLRGNRFCVDSGAAALGSYCASVVKQGRTVTFTDLRSGVLSTATLIPR